ncbi:hypothetical protein KQX54_005800 [Cotesia glomerata]|uniref:Uncharacterized protein n=1 Tax=Cotesia glomerata TaxID=32391 RepID=A0AAV7J1E1_COTGL|nr:hypothetical protein KQX54_005800 [Cotesia glomerata]
MILDRPKSDFASPCLVLWFKSFKQNIGILSDRTEVYSNKRTAFNEKRKTFRLYCESELTSIVHTYSYTTSIPQCYCQISIPLPMST